MSERPSFFVALGRKFARLATMAVVRRPALWRVFRRPLRFQFNVLAPRWETIRSPDSLAPFEAALARLDPPPARALDLGTGTGAAAFALARRFPEAEVVGVDLSPEMIEQARQLTPSEPAPRLRFEVADGAQLPFEDGAFDLVALANMIPFFDELARVTAPAGHLVISFSQGAETPIYVPLERLRRELEERGFTDFAEIPAGSGIALLARKRGGS